MTNGETKTKNYNYYVLEFKVENSKMDVTSSMCVLGVRQPTIKEAKEFWKEDCSLYGDETLQNIYEISSEEAHSAYDMEKEEMFPIFGTTERTEEKNEKV